MKGAKHYWVADLTKGYWQVRLAEDSQWLFCFATPFGPYKYLRAPMGSKATTPYFDKCMAGMLEGAGLLRKGFIMIHDDHAGYAERIYDDDPEGRSHYHLLRRYLKLCAELNVRISPKKFEVYLTKPDIAGHEHADGGMRPCLPTRYQAIIEAPDPTTVGDVYHGTSAMGWCRSFIPNFAVLERPIRAFIMKALNGGAQKIRRAKNRQLKNHGWNDELLKAYNRIKLALVNPMKRAYRDPNKIPVLIWDSGLFQICMVIHGRSNRTSRNEKSLARHQHGDVGDEVRNLRPHPIPMGYRKQRRVSRVARGKERTTPAPQQMGVPRSRRPSKHRIYHDRQMQTGVVGNPGKRTVKPLVYGLVSQRLKNILRSRGEKPIQ